MLFGLEDMLEGQALLSPAGTKPDFELAGLAPK